jgi:hypothetical protein
MCKSLPRNIANLAEFKRQYYNKGSTADIQRERKRIAVVCLFLHTLLVYKHI